MSSINNCLKIDSVFAIASPLFFMANGDVGYNYQVVAEVGCNRFTHERVFDDVEAAEKLADRIRSHQVINLGHWREGTAWDYYEETQTYEEEREEALYNERWGL